MGSHTTSANFSSYDTSHYSYYNVNSSYPLSNAYTASSSTSYAQIRWTRGASAQTYIYYKFALNIPSTATITSVTVKSKAYINTTTASRVTTRTMQLADSRDQTTFGSTLTIGSSATEQTFSNTGITWTPEKLNNLCVKFLIVRGTSNTTSSYNLQIYGGTVSVEYTLPDCTITTTNNTSYTFNVPASHESGNAFTITCSNSSSPSALGLTVTVNDTDITSQFISAGGVWVCTISGLSTNVTVVINYATALYLNVGSSETLIGQTAYSGDPDFGTCTYNYKTIFDSLSVGDTVHFSGRIGWYSSGLTYRDSVAINDTFIWGTTNTRTYSEGTYVYTITFPSTSNYTIPDNTITPKPASWAAPSFSVYVYKVDGGGPWKKVSKAYKKVSGSWVEQSDLTTVFDSTKHYKKGN